MWCSNCHQDVPTVAPSSGGRPHCSRCQQPLRSAGPSSPAAPARVCDAGLELDEPATATAAATPPIHRFEWHAQQRVRELSRKLRRPGAAPTAATAAEPAGRATRLLHSPPAFVSELEFGTEPAFAQAALRTIPRSAGVRRSHAGQAVAWLIVLAGALTLAAGVGLIAWSLYGGPLPYWNLALGLTLGGQGALVLGLVLVVMRLWRTSRSASNKLLDVQSRLEQLQRTADVLAANRPGGAPAFYADLVRGASPHVLLANLKGQIDQLATRIGSGW